MESHILIIDDGTPHGTLLSSALTEAGYTVSVLADTGSIVPFLRERAVNLVISLTQIHGPSRGNTPMALPHEPGTASDLVRESTQESNSHVVEPDEAAELLARVHALLRCVESAQVSTFITVGTTTRPLRWLFAITSSEDMAPVTPVEMQLLTWLWQYERGDSG